MPYLKVKRGDQICVYKRGADGQPEGESLGCHANDEDAQKQIAAIWANEATAFRQREGALWIDRATMAALCPGCAQAMEGAGLDRINVRALEQMPEQMKQGLCSSMGGDPGFFESCMSKSFGEFDPGDKESFCAWLHHECQGIWPGEHEAVMELPAEESQRVSENVTLGATLAEGDASGASWEIVILGPESPADRREIEGAWWIRSKNGRWYQENALREAAPLFDGARVYDDHLTDAEFQQRGGLRSVAKEWLGSIVQPRWNEAEHALVGVFRAVDDGFRTKLMNAQKGRVLDTIGLSIDVFQQGLARVIDGVKAQLIDKILKVNSVDAVGEPAAGGRFVRALESIMREERNMEELIKQCDQLIAAVEASMLPDDAKAALKAELEKCKAGMSGVGGEKPGGETQEAQLAQAREALTKIAADAQRQMEAAQKKAGSDVEEARRLLAEAKAESQRILDAARAAEGQRVLEAQLSQSGLPEVSRAVIRKQFADRAVEAETLKTAIEDQRSVVLALTEDGHVSGHARPRIQVGRLTEADRFALALMRLMAGSTKFDRLVGEFKDKPAFKALVVSQQTRALEAWIADGKPAMYRPSNLREWYKDFSDDDYLGIGQFGRRAIEANLTTATLASVVKNAVNVLLAADYSVRQAWWQDLVYEEDVDTIDDATLVRLFGISTLPIVNEGGAYTELDMEDEEETASFFKRGGYVGITLETFMRDKLGKLREIPTKLSNAWYNTLSTRIAALFTLNSAAGPVLSDSGALFNATAVSSAGGHVNLLTTALSHAAWDAVVTAMMKQTDQPLGAGERLGMENKPTHLLVPINLRNTALEIRNSQYVPGSANLTTNQYYQDFEVVVVPGWTDATDWAALAKPSAMSPIHMIYVRGRRTPELFTAEDENNGSMFTNDEIRYKVRQFAAEFSATYACAPVADWRSLHKNNVAG